MSKLINMSRLAEQVNEATLTQARVTHSLAKEIRANERLIASVAREIYSELRNHDEREVRSLDNFVERLDDIRKQQMLIRAKLYELNFTECEKCGCVIKVKQENKGQSTVASTADGHEYIKEHYYCKTHMPKSK